MSNYQDIWHKGELVEKGVRDCETRYQAIKNIASQYTRPFSVLDIGANSGYFTIRLAEEFPNCTCIAVEPKYLLVDQVRHLPNVIVIEKSLSLDDLKSFSKREYFDMVLCLSAIHYLDKEAAYSEIAETLTLMGDHLFLELPVEEETLVSRLDEMLDLIESLDSPAIQIKSHVNTEQTRPLFHLEGRALTERYSRWNTEYPVRMKIETDFNKSNVSFLDKPETRCYYPGINLWTYLELNGVYPERGTVASLVEKADWSDHNDINLWNIILSGEKVSVIDRKDPGHPTVVPVEKVKDMITDIRSYKGTNK